MRLGNLAVEVVDFQLALVAAEGTGGLITFLAVVEMPEVLGVLAPQAILVMQEIPVQHPLGFVKHSLAGRQEMAEMVVMAAQEEMAVVAEGRDIGFVASAEVVHRDHLVATVQMVFHHVRTNETCASSD